MAAKKKRQEKLKMLVGKTFRRNWEKLEVKK